MNIILIHPGETDGDQVVLRDHRARHIRKVLKSKPGDSLRVGLLDGPIGTGLVRQLDAEQVVLQLDCRTPPPPKAATDLILALPRPIMLKRVLSQATAMGVARIMLINANRVEKSFWQSSLLAAEPLAAALHQGLEQAVDTRPPAITLHRRFRPFIEDLLPSLGRDYPRRLLAHPAPQPTPSHSSTRPPDHHRCLLAIGPEGGWVDFELEAFRQQGFLPFSLGARILRVDTAVPALLAAVAA